MNGTKHILLLSGEMRRVPPGSPSPATPFPGGGRQVTVVRGDLNGKTGMIYTINEHGLYTVVINGDSFNIEGAWLDGGRWAVLEKTALLGRVEINTTGRGACFYQAISLGLTNPPDESLAAPLRHSAVDHMVSRGRDVYGPELSPEEFDQFCVRQRDEAEWVEHRAHRSSPRRTISRSG